VVDRASERSGFGAVPNHGAKQPVKAAAPRGAVADYVGICWLASPAR
jgi:hypothetical protein